MRSAPEAGSLAGLTQLGRSSSLIKQARKIGKEEVYEGTSRLCLIEGERALKAAVGFRVEIALALFLENDRGARAYGRLKDSVAEARCFRVSETAMALATTTKSPPPCAAVARVREPKKLDPSPSVAVALDGVAEPGNLGAVIRCCAALLGQSATVLVDENCCDPYSPKCVRGSAGAIFGIGVYRVNLKEALYFLKSHGSTLIGTSPRGGQDPATFPWPPKVVILLGSEAHGLSRQYAALVEQWLSIPIWEGVESLNVAVACGLVLEHMRRAA